MVISDTPNLRASSRTSSLSCLLINRTMSVCLLFTAPPSFPQTLFETHIEYTAACRLCQADG